MSQSAKRITLMRPDGVALSRRVFLRSTLIGATALAGSIPMPAEAQYGSGAGASSGGGAGGGAAGGTGARSGAAGGGAGRAKEAKSAAPRRMLPCAGFVPARLSSLRVESPPRT